MHTEYKEQLKKKVKDLISSFSKDQLKSGVLSEIEQQQEEEKLKMMFKEEWEKWIEELKKEAKVHKEKIDVKKLVQKSLTDFFKTDEQTLVKKLKAKNFKQWGRSLKLELQESHVFVKQKSGIIAWTHRKAGEMFREQPNSVPVLSNPQHRKCLEATTKYAFDRVREYLSSRERENFNPTYTIELLDKLKEAIHERSRDHPHLNLTKEYTIDMSLTACSYASRQFQDMVDAFQKQNDPIEYLNNLGLPQPFDDMTIRDTACYEVAQTEQTLSIATDKLTEAKQSQILTSQRIEQVTVIIDETTRPPTRDLRFVLKEKCDLIPHKSEGPLLYRLAGRETVVKLPSLNPCRVSIGEPAKGVPEKVLILFGASGAGKSTLINAMINYILGVEWKDDFRFKLITDEAKSQAHSQTSEITAYTIHHMEGSKVPYDITIIDTPGFGDTDRCKQDEEITKQVAMFLTNEGHNGISHLNGIGFVIQSAIARLTPTQQYIFDSILSMFGKDVAKNIFMMVTFADGQKPPVMTAIETASIPHSGFFKFNNAALFAEVGDENEDNFVEMFWKMGVNSFKRFFTSFQKAQNVSLPMNVLKQRERLLAIYECLLKHVQECVSYIEVLQQEKIMMRQHKADIIANRGYTFQIKVPYYTEEHLPPGTYALNCLYCNQICHYPCIQPDDDSKRYCPAMSGDYCTVCEGHCHWSKHKSTGTRFTLCHRTESRTDDQLKKNYESAARKESAL